MPDPLFVLGNVSLQNGVCGKSSLGEVDLESMKAAGISGVDAPEGGDFILEGGVFPRFLTFNGARSARALPRVFRRVAFAPFSSCLGRLFDVLETTIAGELE